MKTSIPQWYAAVGNTARNTSGKKPTYSNHTTWSNTMTSSTFWKSIAIVAVVFLFAAMEAAAQLPVRTQQLQLLSPGGGALTQNMPAAGVTSYTVTWPATSDHDGGAPAVGDNAILWGTYAAPNDWQLSWLQSDGFVDGNGATNHVTYWSPDGSTLHAQENFEFNPVTGLLGIGVNNTPSVLPEAPAAGTAGSVQIGDGTDAEITLIGSTGVGTFGVGNTIGQVDIQDNSSSEINLLSDNGSSAAVITVGATANDGLVNVTNGGTTSIELDGATATATIGTNAAQAGTIVMTDANGQELTVVTGDMTSDWTLQPNDHTAGDATYYVAPNTNAIATDGSMDNNLLIANADGTATWGPNPIANLKAGNATLPAVATPNLTAGGPTVYTATVTFVSPYPVGVTPVVTVTTDHPTNANILQVTATSNTAFTVTSTAPLLVGDGFNWVALEPYDP